MDESQVVLDASALLALLRQEPGGELVEPLVSRALMSSVNWSEVVQKALDQRADVGGLREDLEALGLEIVPFNSSMAERAAALRASTRHLGLSLGDRACLALAAELDIVAVTADRLWAGLSVGVAIQTIR